MIKLTMKERVELGAWMQANPEAVRNNTAKALAHMVHSCIGITVNHDHVTYMRAALGLQPPPRPKPVLPHVERETIDEQTNVKLQVLAEAVRRLYCDLDPGSQIVKRIDELFFPNRSKV